MSASRNGLALVELHDVVPSEADDHRDALDRLLAGARDGLGGSVVLRGEPPTLLEYVVGRAKGMHVARLAGIESEMPLDFAALHQLLVPFLSDLGRLPEPQRDALRAAFGLITAPTPDLFVIGLAVLGLLTGAAADEPLLVVVDDAQWLDHASAEVLAFVARRLGADPIALVIGVPEPTSGRQPFPDLPDLRQSDVMTRENADDEPRTPLDALYDGLLAGRLASACALPAIIRTARSRTQSAPTVAGLLTDGFVARLTDQHRVAVPILRRAVAGLLADESPAHPLLALGTWAAGEIMDSKAQQAIADRWVHATGEQTTGGQTTGGQITGGQITGGQPLIASSLPSQPDASGSSDLLTLAWSGREAETRSAAAQQVRHSIERGHGLGITFSDYALVILELGLSHYEAALTYALNVYRDDPPDLGTHVLPDLVEAATRSGCQDIARVALDRLSDRATASGTPLASGLLARSRALLADNATAESLYREAMDHLRRSGDAVHLARAHLVCGEWLRRRRRRRDAREHLRTARDMFDALGATAFARRTSTELQATNETLGEAAGLLTPQEMRVARLVREGFANREVAAQLFISLNTVEYHLQKVYRKLGVSSRTQLARTMVDQGHGDQPPVR